MRQLILLRHAHARAAEPGQSDFDRPLSALGRGEAAAAGRWLRDHGLVADLALCSPARRARETFEQATGHWPAPPPRDCEPIYGASPGELIRLLDGQTCDCVVLVGHNPGLEELVALLVEGRSGDHRGLPPAGVAVIELPSGAAIEPGLGRLSAFWSP